MTFPLSLEFFPPKTPEGAEKLRAARQKLYALRPEFCSVTFGAGGVLLMLAKPQFELQPAQLGKGGIVRDEALYPQVERRIRDACTAAGLQVQGWFDSPIRGGDGNREFFVLARKEPR